MLERWIKHLEWECDYTFKSDENEFGLPEFIVPLDAINKYHPVWLKLNVWGLGERSIQGTDFGVMIIEVVAEILGLE